VLNICLVVCFSHPHSGKVIIIFGSNATLDAGQKGRFFYGDGSSKEKTSLELRDMTLKNGNAQRERNFVSIFFEIPLNCFGAYLTNRNCFRDFSSIPIHFQTAKLGTITLLVQDVSLGLLAFICTTFQLRPSIFCIFFPLQNYFSKSFAPIPGAGDMQLLGWSYFY
jgi:hypothetical protein